ncbi:MAG: hypothetical protein ACI93R_003578 [Flavobacteriales bacterium]|jgi:hypothetical protein
MSKAPFLLSMVIAFFALPAQAKPVHEEQVDNDKIAKQRLNLAGNAEGKGFGPQSPRNINSSAGKNTRIFGTAPASTELNLCNIHFHKNAEHAGGEFTRYAGNGDGHGFQTGYGYSGKLSQAESTPVTSEICPSEHGGLQSGDTIEVHYVHSSAQVKPGPTLGSCLSESIKNPQLRVETLVVVLVNGSLGGSLGDNGALDFSELTKVGKVGEVGTLGEVGEVGELGGKFQALNIPNNTGTPVVYEGSTTGPSYSEAGSPFQVTWSVRPNIVKVDIETVGEWCKDNVFDEDHAHGVRNLVINPSLLSPIK